MPTTGRFARRLLVRGPFGRAVAFEGLGELSCFFAHSLRLGGKWGVANSWGPLDNRHQRLLLATALIQFPAYKKDRGGATEYAL
jgi:hypothetical protein